MQPCNNLANTKFGHSEWLTSVMTQKGFGQQNFFWIRSRPVCFKWFKSVNSKSMYRLAKHLSSIIAVIVLEFEQWLLLPTPVDQVKMWSNSLKLTSILCCFIRFFSKEVNKMTCYEKDINTSEMESDGGSSSSDDRNSNNDADLKWDFDSNTLTFICVCTEDPMGRIISGRDI